MKTFSACCVAWLLVVAVQSARLRRGEDTYPTLYDNVDVDQILSNERILKSYVACLLDKGSCTPDAQLLKENLPDGLETGCVKCSEIQKKKFKKLVKFVKNHDDDDYKKMLDKYDPDRNYVKKYGDEFEKLFV